MGQKIVVVVREPEDRQATLSVPVARALGECFAQRGWSVVHTTKRINEEPDLIAGWGFREVIHEAWDRWPDKILHVDASFWRRETYHKVELGGRWLPATGRFYHAARLNDLAIKVTPDRQPGRRILVCGMSAKAAISCGVKPEAWEQDAVARLTASGAKCIYRPKPSWPGARPLVGAKYDRSGDIDQALRCVHGVVSHHSNVAVDALAVGLPIYVETGIAKPLSVAKLEDIVGAVAPERERRLAFLREVAWHQWTLKELETGAWLKPPAPLAGHPLLGSE